MRRRMVVKWISAGLILCLGMSSVTGCENKTVDYGEEEGTEDVRGKVSTGNMNLKQFEDTPQWKEEWTAENADGTVVRFSVNAKISVPDAEQMSVVEVTEPTLDASYKEKIAEQIFDSTKIYYNDIPHLPKKELEEGRADLAAAIEACADSAAEDSMMEELETKLMSYDEALETAKYTYTPVAAYDVDKYIGERDGIFYELSFEEYDEKDSFCRFMSMYLSPKDIYQVCPEKMREMEGLSCTSDESDFPDSDDISAKNQCALSEEEALEEARNFVEKLGLDYSVVRSLSPLFWQAYREEDIVEAEYQSGYKTTNGYRFIFDAGIDLLSFPLFGIQQEYESYSRKSDVGKGRYSLSATLNVTVTDMGVIGMYVENPIEITGIMDGVELLPVDEIKGIIQEQIVGHFEDYHFENYRNDYLSVGGGVVFNKMELIYFRVRDKENPGRYSYVPTWRLSKYDDSSDVGKISNVVLINAIDGSVIDLFDEI